MQDAMLGEPAYILENSVFHARHLPVASKHAFTYPTIALLLSLSALESHEIDLGSGRLFGYCDAGCSRFRALARVAGVRPEAYLHDPESYRNMKETSIRDKLEDVLSRYGHNPTELRDAWMLTMPSYLGVEGINPLTVFYCYKKADTKLWIVVLEVHNTFGERHVYVLPTGPQHEDGKTVPGFTHSWTIPRQFHVSPFNDRSGYYTCSLGVPPYPPPLATSPSISTATLENSKTPPPPSLPRVLIQLWTPDKQLKLTASLRSTASVPLTSHGLLSVLASYPLTLLLSFARIAWQAFHLHYHRHLDVYARPEPRAIDPAIEASFGDGDNQDQPIEKNDGIPRNAVQREEESGELGTGGGLGWQPEGLLEAFARRRIERFLEARAREIGISVHLVSTNPALGKKTFLADSDPTRESGDPDEPEPESNEEKKAKELIIIVRSSRAFLLILASPSPAHALLLARDAEQLLWVSNHRLFHEVFSIPSPLRPRSEVDDADDADDAKDAYGSLASLPQRILQRIRKLPIPRSLLEPGPKLEPCSDDVSGSGIAPSTTLTKPIPILIPIPLIHPLDIPSLSPFCTKHPYSHSTRPIINVLRNTISALPTLLVLSAFFAVTYFERTVFTAAGARFVKGTEPWGFWARAEAALALARLRAVGSREGG